MTQSGSINGYENAYWTGITTLELAKSINAAIQQDLTSLYHLVPKKKISKYELLELIREIWGQKITILKEYQHRDDKSLINNRDDFNYNIPTYRTMLNELFRWMKNREYNFYNY